VRLLAWLVIALYLILAGMVYALLFLAWGTAWLIVWVWEFAERELSHHQHRTLHRHRS
jgi:hypothetical protein